MISSITQVISLLGHAVGEHWATCDSTCTVEGRDEEIKCCKVVRHSGRHSVTPDGMAVTWGSDRDAIALPAMLDEWKSEWVASGGDPLRGPVDEWSDGQRSWWVDDCNNVSVRVGEYIAERLWEDDEDGGDWTWEVEGNGPAEDVFELGRIMKALDEVPR